MGQVRQLRTIRTVAISVALSAIGLAFLNVAGASCVGPKEGGRWWNKNPAGSPISLEVTLDECGDQVLNGQQTETRYGVKVFVKQSSGALYQRPKVRATYRTSNGKRWLYAKVPTGGYVDHVWMRSAVVNGQTQLYVYIKHESLDSKPSAESKFWFSRQRTVAAPAPEQPNLPGGVVARPSPFVKQMVR